MPNTYNILLIDDNKKDVLYFKKLLSKISEAHFYISNSICLNDGITQFKNKIFDSVFIDLELPDSKGLNTLIKFMSHYPDIPIIVLTGLDDSAARCEALKQGANDYLVKSTFDAHDLYKAFIFASQQKEIEKTIKHNEKKDRNLAENLPDIIIRLNTNMKILYANRSTFNLVNKNIKIINEQICSIHPFQKFSENWRNTIKEAILKGTEKNMQIQYKPENNQLFYYDWKFLPEKNENSEVESVLCVARDITHLQKIQTELEQAKDKAEKNARAKTIFLTNMSHELRTPLNAIIGFSQLLLNNVSIEKVEEYGKLINLSGRKLLEVIEEIFEFSILESNEIKTYAEDFNIKDIINETKNIIINEQNYTGKSNIDIHVDLYENKPDLLIKNDKQKLLKVISYLAKNAVKFTKKGSISVGYNKINSNSFEFYIKDTGIGIPEDKQESVFEEFSQADEGDSREFGGAGLGLTIAKKMINYMGGEIKFYSEPGKGSVFKIILNYHNIIKKADIIEKPTERNNLEGIKILIAEDEELNYFFLETLLEEEKAEIKWAKNGKEAVELIKKGEAYNLILMDMKMPEMDGYEATQKIKQLKPETIIIGQSAYALSNDDIKARNLGCDEYLTKPIDAEELLYFIYKYVNNINVLIKSNFRTNT